MRLEASAAGGRLKPNAPKFLCAPEPCAGPMLISIFGTPSPLTYWGVHVVRAIAHVCHGEHHFIQSIYFRDLRDAWFKRDGKGVIFVSECPESQVSDLFIRSGAPIFLFADDPGDVIGYAMASRGLGLHQALRFASQSYCTLSNIVRTDGAFVVRPSHYGGGVRALVRQILAFLEGAVSDELAELAMAHILSDYRAGDDSTIEKEVLRIIPGARRPGGFAVERTETAHRLIDSVIQQYAAIFEGRVLRKVEWPREIFLDWDRGEAFVAGPLQLVGPARFIICGPYMHLTRGEWLAKVEIEVSENHSGNRLRADIVAGDIQCVVDADLPGEGVFAFEMAFAVVEPLLPVEIRFQILSGAIEGRFFLRRVRIERAPVDLAPSERVAEPAAAIDGDRGGPTPRPEPVAPIGNAPPRLGAPGQRP